MKLTRSDFGPFAGRRELGLTEASHVGAFVGAVQLSAAPALERLLSSQVEKTLAAVAGAFGPMVAIIAVELLKGVTKALGESTENPTLAKVELLRRAPLQRARIQLTEAVEADSTQGAGTVFQQQRLMAALESLDEAESLATEGELPTVVFLKALTSSAIAGGDRAAISSCDRFQGLAATLSDLIDTEVQKNEERLQFHLRQLAKMPIETSPRTGSGLVGGLVAWDGAIDPIARSGYEMKAAARRKRGKELKAVQAEIEWASGMIGSLRDAIRGRPA